MACKDCGVTIPDLEVFPGPRCLACHTREFDKQAAKHGLPKPDFRRAVRRIK